MTTTPNDLLYVGDKVRLWFETRKINLDGTKELADPTLLSITVMQEDAAEDDWTEVAWPTSPLVVVRYSLGKFYYEYTITEDDMHNVVAKATGAVVVAGQGTFDVAVDPTA